VESKPVNQLPCNLHWSLDGSLVPSRTLCTIFGTNVQFDIGGLAGLHTYRYRCRTKKGFPKPLPHCHDPFAAITVHQ
jgi:hypothetical protein